MRKSCALLLLFISMAVIGFAQGIKPATPPANFTSKVMAVENGLTIHYVIGGKGQPLLLLHGFGQNWYMWERLLPELSKHFTVIAPDLPGLGESGKPADGYDKKTMALHIHALMQKLGFNNIMLAGHDIGLMVAYAYARQYENEVTKLVLMDALLPGVEPVWSQVRGAAWWFGFFAWPASPDIVEGKAKTFLTGFWPVVGYVKDPFTKQESDEFIRAYSVHGSIAGSFHWFAAFPQDARDNQEFMKHKLKMPLLAMAGEFASSFLPEHCRLVADNVKGVIIKDAGHWIVQENTPQVQKEFLEFLLAQ
ncbi:alpha/beta fold hydrolase [Chitinophaga sp. HK235]|uniref:alpha/beta fold hydrolase n=1 Tax=Chitinophaga sp. HK235 TaxID=2952571 RepID=UPI001BAD7EB9|nr:alpha/beta hydrolase [Chitinophaga sp. HK235]